MNTPIYQVDQELTLATGRPDRGIYLNSNKETQPTAVSDVTGRYIVDNSNNLMEYKRHIKAVLEKIREANLKLKPSKCQWFQTELKFMGHLVGRNGIRPDPRNVEKIKNAEIPKNTTELRRFLGMA